MRTTQWRRDEQTEGKHLILGNYLDGWFPILGSWHRRLLFIDGFAGPGSYLGGERGSPLIALDCLRRHKKDGRLKDVEVICVFIESDKKRADHLDRLLRKQPAIPDTSFDVLSGTFEDHMTDILDYIDKQNKELAPAFVMIDPFGPKGSPIRLIERVLRNDRSECMISFMYEPIRRFHQEPENEVHLNELFGTDRWKRCLDMDESDAKKKFLHDLFSRQLKRHGAGYVVPFELWKGNRHVYTVYFVSGSVKGCDLMKASIWKVDPTGNSSFRGYVAGQSLLFEPSTEPLAEQLKEEFGGVWVPIERIEEFVMGDRTMFHKGHLRQKTLQPLERKKRITVRRPQGGRGFPSGRGIKIRFH